MTDENMQTLGVANQDNLERLRAEYSELTGKRFYHGWDEDELQRKIDESLERPSEKIEPPTQKLTVKINRDYWDENGERHCSGDVVDLPLEQAIDGIESGALSRVKK